MATNWSQQWQGLSIERRTVPGICLWGCESWGPCSWAEEAEPSAPSWRYCGNKIDRTNSLNTLLGALSHHCYPQCDPQRRTGFDKFVISIFPVNSLESALSKGQRTMPVLNTQRHNQERLLAKRGNQSMNMQTVPFRFGLIDGVHLLPKPAVRKRTQR